MIGSGQLRLLCLHVAPILQLLGSDGLAPGLAAAQTCPYTSALTQSFSSCTDLGWTNAATYGSTAVCGESDTGLGGCSGDVTWSCAVGFCESAGTRLCSLAEMAADEARGTGCAYDPLEQWTATPCAAG